MRVLFDLAASQPLGGSVYHGGGEYAKAVFQALVEAGYVCDALYDSTRDLDPRMEELCVRGGITKVDLAGRSYAEACKGYDTFFTALPYGKFGSEGAGNCRLIATVHGARSLEIPRDRYEIPFYLGSRAWKRIAKALFIRVFPRRYRQIAGRRVSRLLSVPGVTIITVSEHTKYSLLNFFPELKDENLKVCYSPLFTSADEKQIKEAEGRLGSELNLTAGNYYLALGSGRWLKNNLRLARAFDRLVSEGRLAGRKLVLTGGSHPVYRSPEEPGGLCFPGLRGVGGPGSSDEKRPEPALSLPQRGFRLSAPAGHEVRHSRFGLRLLRSHRGLRGCGPLHQSLFGG